MARRHWRFVVRDRYGFTIQNALVYVYQPGTTNAFVGSAYAADAGGSPITNPFTTNQFGEVEGYFDTEQSIDVFVTDNTDTAYRATDGSGVPISFTSFTERDEIHIEPTDDFQTSDHHVVGTATELQDITLALQAESAGSSGKWADGQHIHGHVAFSGNPHGAADHTDITRSLWLPMESATPDTLVFANLGTTPNMVRVQTVDTTTAHGHFWAFAVPRDWASGSLSVQLYFVVSAVATTGIRFQIVAKSRAVGDDVTAAGTTVAWTHTLASEAINTLIKATVQDTTVTPAAIDDLIELNVRRVSADGADTFTGTVSFIGALVTYTANQ